MTAIAWSRWDHLGKFRLYIPPEKRRGFPNQPASDTYDSRGWRITRPESSANVKPSVQRLMIEVEPSRFVNQVSAIALGLVIRNAPLGHHYICEGVDGSPSPWSTYHPIRLGRVGGPDIAEDDAEPIYEPACEWMPLRLQRFATRYTEPRRWLGVPMSGRAPIASSANLAPAWRPSTFPVYAADIPGSRPAAAIDRAAPTAFYQSVVHPGMRFRSRAAEGAQVVEFDVDIPVPAARRAWLGELECIGPPSVLGNLHTLSRLASAWARTGDPIWRQRAEAWRWWRDFRYPASGYGAGDPKEDRDPDSTNPKSRPTITETMRAAGWSGSEKTGWDTTTAATPTLAYADGADAIERKFWRILLGDLVFGEFVEWGYNKQGKPTAFPKVGLRQFGTTKKGRTLRPRDERGEERKPAATIIDGAKWPRPEYQKRWASELRSYLGLSGAVPYYAEPYQRPINPPAIGYGEAEYPKAPIRPEVEAARKFLVDRGVDGSVPLAQARANAGLPPLPNKPEKPHAERYAEFQERLARYRAGENLRLVEPRDLGDAIILGIRDDGSVVSQIWRGGVMNPSPTKPARIDVDGWIADKIDRGNSDEASTESPDDIETGGTFLDRLGEHVEILDDAISAVTAEQIARGKGLAPEYAKVEGARMVDRALDNLYALLRPVAEKTRTLVADNDNRNKEQKIAA